ncbi:MULTISPECIES: STAS domain-containing protein [unclassified Streptomyces]|uniref:STAS domain-containing protein n=1 Tax=unclassified Streptomyces TaxID=2593676 RepID=UPI0004C0BD56|nr:MULTISPECIES: STAS domain-containing protein [unclassified Streptomyces]
MHDTEGTLAISTHSSPDGLVVLRLTGELDHYTSPGFRRAVEDVLRDSGAAVVADLSALDYCDSSGMTAIITAYRLAQAAGTSFSVAALSEAMTQLFRVAGLDQVLTLHSSVQEAVDSFSG